MNMLKETFVEGSSLLHKRDPRLRIVFASCFSIILAVSHRYPTLLTGLGCACCMVLLAQLPLGKIVRSLIVINVFNLILFAMLPLTFEGQPLYHLGPLTGSLEGTLLALQISLKSNAILLGFIALVSTMPIATLGHALNRLHMPQKLVYLLLIAYRYVFVLEQEYHRLTTAARVRGFYPGTNLHSYKTVAYLFGMLLVRSLARAERVYQAMLCRGFQGRFYCIHTFSLNGSDRLWAGLMSLLLILLVYFEWLNKWMQSPTMS
jgi:cobalt/nickel transport system permease protein